MPDPRLANLPALRKLAEEEARVRQDALADAWPSMDPCPPPTWASMSPAEREYLIAVELSLLSDLTRWQSQRAMEWLMAAKLRPSEPPVTTAPCLYWTAEVRDSTDSDGAPNGDGWPEGWWLDCGNGNMHFFSWEDWCPDPGAHTMIAGLKGVTDPAEALTLIALHVLGSPDAHR